MIDTTGMGMSGMSTSGMSTNGTVAMRGTTAVPDRGADR
jgi:hypothetical protein